jgi:hypothetical protein
MVTQTETIIPTLPDFAKQPTADIAKTLEALLGQQLKVPQQEVAGFSPTQLSAMNLATQGIGSFRPFLQDARSAQTAGAETIGLGTQIAAGADFGPGAYKPFFDQYQQDVTGEALKEIDRQAAMAQNQLAGQAVKAGAFGGSRFGVAQSELSRSAQDLKSRRIFEDMSRNFQQAQGAARAANQQRLQAGQVFGQLGRGVGSIGGAIAGLGGQLQQQQRQDVNQLLGIGGLQQQQLQRESDVGTANIAAMQNAPFQRLSTSAGILQQLLPNLVGSQTIAPFAQPNPYAQMAGLVAGAGGLAGLL